MQHTIVIFLKKALNHVGALFENNGKMRSWKGFRAKLELNGNRKFYWIQIIHRILSAWKRNIFTVW